MISLKTSISEISPIAKKLNSRLKKLGINTIEDLFYHFPVRYDDFSQVKKINQLIAGEKAIVKGRINLIENRRSPLQRKLLTQAIFSDESGDIKVVWFNRPYLLKTIKQGDELYLFGKVQSTYESLQIVSPDFEKVRSIEKEGGFLLPIYDLTAGISNKHLRFFVKTSLNFLNSLIDYLPPESRKKHKLLDLNIALKEIHFPSNRDLLHKAIVRLKFDELFLIQLKNQILKQKNKKIKAERINFKEKEIKDFVKKIPFKLTDDQRKATWAILLDMQKKYPMNRLLNGDVGSGKTIVSAIAMFNVALNGFQSAYMAPTEILAGQQFKALIHFFQGENLKLALFTRVEHKICSLINEKIEKIKKKDLLEKIKRGEINIVIGTHALIQEKVFFKKMALVVIDEQHRFGVEQRKALTLKSGNKKTEPHFLSMTATPIPRTLHLALFGDLNVSLIKEMPKGRKKIITKIVESSERQKTYDFVRKEIEKGKLAFVVCPLIDESDKLGVRSVKEEFKKLSQQVFPDLKIALLHGKLKADEKEKIMKEFSNGKIKILVSTSVIEVGVDVKDATIMLIEGAERFGLSQLHQFRGRVGRNSDQSYCFLFSDNLSEKSRERLEALVENSDGFELSKKDLELRGPGEVFGKSQSGFPELKIASFFDYVLVEKANQEAINLLESDCNYSPFKEKIKEFEEKVHLE